MSELTILGILAGVIGTATVGVSIVWYVIQAVAYWKIFQKAGAPGWKSLIPFYNVYTQYQLTWQTNMFWIAFLGSLIGSWLSSMTGVVGVLGSLLTLVSSIVGLVANYKFSLAFGHGIGFAIGLMVLNPIFILILGFGSSEYQGPQ